MTRRMANSAGNYITADGRMVWPSNIVYMVHNGIVAWSQVAQLYEDEIRNTYAVKGNAEKILLDRLRESVKRLP